MQSGGRLQTALPAQADTHTGQVIRIRGFHRSVPGPAVIHERGKLDYIRPGFFLDYRYAPFQRGNNGIVANQLIFPVTPNAIPASYCNLFQRKKRFVRQLNIGAENSLTIPQRQSVDPLELPQPGNISAVRNITVIVYGGVSCLNTKAEPGGQSQHLSLGSLNKFLRESQGSNL